MSPQAEARRARELIAEKRQYADILERLSEGRLDANEIFRHWSWTDIMNEMRHIMRVNSIA